MAKAPRTEDLEAVDALMAASAAPGGGSAPPQDEGPAADAAPPADPAMGQPDPQRLLVDIQGQLDQLRAMLGGG